MNTKLTSKIHHVSLNNKLSGLNKVSPEVIGKTIHLRSFGTKKLNSDANINNIPFPNLRRRYPSLELILDRREVTVIMTFVTIYALFGDDLRLCAFDKKSDDIFYTFSTISLILFIFELILNCLCKPNYLNLFSFYLYLDIISTFSIIPDIGWIWDPLVGAGKSSSFTALKAGRASRAGTKAGRIVRLVRLIRIMKLYRRSQDNNSNNDKIKMKSDIAEPSKIGKILTEITTRRLIILVLSIVIILPIIDGTYQDNVDEFQSVGLSKLHRFTQDYNRTGEITMSSFKNTFESYARNAGGILNITIHSMNSSLLNEWLKGLRFQTADSTDPTNWNITSEFKSLSNPNNGWEYNKVISTNDVLKYYRTSEYSSVEIIGCYNNDGVCYDCNNLTTTTAVTTASSSFSSLATSSNCNSLAFFDIKSTSRNDSAYSILKTTFIMFVLSVGALLFTRDAEVLVIGPIERMMSLVNKLAENPLANTKLDDEEPVTKEEKIVQNDKKDLNDTTKNKKQSKKKIVDDYETKLLEKTLQKIGGLLQVGFGVAGTEIISKNMKGTGELNVMIPGKKITSIFGFGIIEHFTETCTILEENIITYINTIAEIIHGDANSYYGAANKNIGSAFLLAWKICDGALPGLRDPRDTDETYKILTNEEKIKQRENIYVDQLGDGEISRSIYPTEMVDSALAAVLKMRIDIYHANNSIDGAFRKFTNNNEPGNVHMGFGLHIGWAIEGAIGSKYKIDASYLSPNVNMAARLEAATSQFRVPMLISEWFVNELSPGAKNLCRKIDKVTVKGSAIPMELWTFDITSYPSAPLNRSTEDRENTFNSTIKECNSITIDENNVIQEENNNNNNNSHIEQDNIVTDEEYWSLVPVLDQNGSQIPVDFENDYVFKRLQENLPITFVDNFNNGLNDYLLGNWEEAKIKFLKCLEYHSTDGPTQVLLNVLKEFNYKAPTNWQGFRPLTEK